SIGGVAQVTVLGGAKSEYQIDISSTQLAAYGLSFDDVVKAVTAANVIQAVGRFEDHYKLFLIFSDARLENLSDLQQTIIRSGNNGIVRLNDIATVHLGVVPQWLRVTANGRDAVSLQIRQQPDGNTVQIVAEIRQKLASIKSKIPAGVQIENWYDQSELISGSAATVRDAIIIGVALAALVLFIFLRSIKITFIVLMVVPAVLTTTVLILLVSDMSFNIMTLGGMAAAIGLIVDDAIVMIEHIVRRLRDVGTAGRPRVSIAADEFFAPLLGSSASTTVIFLPLAFLSGVTGAFFKVLSFTMAAALIVSFLIAWLVVPLLAELFATNSSDSSERRGRIGRSIEQSYRRVLGLLLKRSWLAVLLVAPLLVAGLVAYQKVGSGFMPHIDEGGFVLDYVAPPGTSLTETDRLLRQVEDILAKTPDVAAYSRRTGAALGAHLTEANSGDFFVRLKPQPRRPIDVVMDDIRKHVDTAVPGLETEFALLMEDLIGDLTAVPQPIEIKLFGDDTNELLATAPKVADAIKKVAGVVDVKDGIVLAGDALNVRVERVKAALEGIDADSITRQLQTMLAGTVTSQIRSGVKLIGIRVWLGADPQRTAGTIADLQLQAPDGHLVPLKRIATLAIQSGQPEITRDDLKGMIAVTGRISERDLGSTIHDIKQVLDNSALIPRSIYYELGGLYKEQQSAFRGLMAVFAAATALVFATLLFMYERFRIAVAIMSMPLLAVAAVFIGLWFANIELNITAMMGMTMIIGIVTEVAIFYFSEYQALLSGGRDARAALIDAGVNRARPIAMTTMAAILALLPLALATNQAAAMQRPLAVAIISGLIIQMPLVLLIMPVLFSRLGRTFR
ncbi:MAG: efflux RND transporter permease subunit, partial [Proteobacteria bacterium]|nr:efflux RND transporter permease subunit [Pseudomonadota bacterium]